MRKPAKYIVVTLTLLALCMAETSGFQSSKAKFQSEAEYLSTIPPQAVPVYNLLKATETLNAALFKSVWYSGTLKVWDAVGVKDYQATVREWRKAWRKELGRYNLRDLRYRYEGDELSGIIHIIHRDKERDGLFVIRENGVWKVRGGD